MVDPNIVTTVALAGVGGAATVAVWALRLEGRITTHEKTDEIIHDYVKQGFVDVKADLASIKQALGVKAV
jgi:shikimate 5-dehydrogenase